MKPTREDLDKIVEGTAADVRSERIHDAAVEDITRRVWSRLSDERPATLEGFTPVERIRTCADFQALIPAYLHGNLSSARALLLEDHTSECIPCRKALKEARVGSAASMTSEPPAQLSRARSTIMKWAIAASLVVGLGIVSVLFIQRFGGAGERADLIVQAAEGPVYRVDERQSQPVPIGATIHQGEKVRTAKTAGALLRLADSSLVEMKERSEVSVRESVRGITIQLQRGNIIVQAAKQRSGHLYVSTDDCLVSVTGTIFSVNRGTKGSRVSVIEGQVQVDHAGQSRVLHPGDQLSTHPSLEQIPLKNEIGWSRDAERYAKLAAELSALRKEIDEKVMRPDLRYSSRLLDLLPNGTVLYVAIPNLSAMLDEAHHLLEERLRQNPALREWWNKEQALSARRTGWSEVIHKIREFGEYLGAEVVISTERDARGEPDEPLVLAELRDPAGFRSYLEQQLTTLNAKGRRGPVARIIGNPLIPARRSTADRNQAELFVWIHGDLLAASPRLSSLQQLATLATASGTSGFKDTSFYSSIASLYREGAGLIIAADLQTIIANSVREGARSATASREREAFKQLGLLNLKHFIAELKESGGKAENRAVLTFDEPRSGIVSWLAPPGPMGALEFISPDANVVTAFVVKDPVTMLDDLLGALTTMDPRLRQQLNNFESESGVNIRDDLAAPLGGEFAFAIDGPLLPTPSWKIVFEVYDPGHLQQALERIAQNFNQWAAKEGKPGFQWDYAELGDRNYYTLRSVGLGLELHYTFTNGYLVAAPNRALVERAIQHRNSGSTLLRSPRFMAALPEDGSANFSALFYHNLAPVLGPLARQMGDAARRGPGDRSHPPNSLASAAPALAYAYAYGDRIIFAANTDGAPLGLSPASLLGLPGSFGLRNILEQALR